MNFTLEKNIVANKLQKAVTINSLQELNDYILKERPMQFNAAGDIHYTYKDSQSAGYFEVWAHYMENGTQSQIDKCAGISDAKVGKVTTNEPPKGVEHIVTFEDPNVQSEPKNKGGRPKKETA